MKQEDNSSQELYQAKPQPDTQRTFDPPKNREELMERMRTAAIAAGKDPDQCQEMAEAFGF